MSVNPEITLGILAGGRATRLGGTDKAWLQRDGIPQVFRLRDALAAQVATTLVSANRDLPRYAEHGLPALTDKIPDAGPLGGIAALLAACRTQWLLTIPVDVLDIPPDLPERLAKGGQGAYAVDDDGRQPLVALWPVASMREAVASTLASNAGAVHQLQARQGMLAVRLHGFRFGNLNTPDDLAAAGMMRRIVD